MRADRRGTHARAHGDLLRGVAAGDLTHHVQLPLGEGQSVRGAAAQERRDEPSGDEAHEHSRERWYLHAVRDGAGLRA